MGGSINVYVHDTTDVILDINGYFAPPGTGGSSLYTLPSADGGIDENDFACRRHRELAIKSLTS